VNRVERRVFCDRPTRAHALARVLIGDDGRRTVVTASTVPSKTGMFKNEATFTEQELDEFSKLVTTALCGCGALWNIDVVPLLRGQDSAPQRVPPEGRTGVSYDRKR